MRRQAEEAERLRANPLLYLTSPGVKVSWRSLPLMNWICNWLYFFFQGLVGSSTADTCCATGQRFLSVPLLQAIDVAVTTAIHNLHCRLIVFHLWLRFKCAVGRHRSSSPLTWSVLPRLKQALTPFQHKRPQEAVKVPQEFFTTGRWWLFHIFLFSSWLLFVSFTSKTRKLSHKNEWISFSSEYFNFQVFLYFSVQFFLSLVPPHF